MKDLTLGFETRLSGGHHNSLGNTDEVANEVIAKPALFSALFNCYFSEDELVRLRTSSAIKRVCLAQPETVAPYLEQFIEDIAKINQASTQWTLAILFNLLKSNMSNQQHQDSLQVMKDNLIKSDDWIVLNTTMETLMHWAKEDDSLKKWFLPKLKQLAKDPRKSVSKRAFKYLTELEKQ